MCVREHVHLGVIVLEGVGRALQLADMLTAARSRDEFERMRTAIMGARVEDALTHAARVRFPHVAATRSRVAAARAGTSSALDDPTARAARPARDAP